MENAEQQTTIPNVVPSRATQIQATESPIPKTGSWLIPYQMGDQPAAGLTREMSMTVEELTSLATLFLSDFQLTSNLTNGNVIYQYQNTLSNFLDHFTNTWLKFMTFITFDLNFHVRVLSSPQTQGQLLMTYDCMPAKMRNLMWTQDHIYHWRLPRKCITLGHNGDYVMSIPWNCPYSKLSQKPTNINRVQQDMGTFSIVIVNRPTYVQGVTPPSLRVWATVSNVKYAGFRPGLNDINP